MGILHLDLGLAVDGVDLPRLDQALLLLCVCVGDELELGWGEGEGRKKDREERDD